MKRHYAYVARMLVAALVAITPLILTACNEDGSSIPIFYTCSPTEAGIVMYNSVSLYSGDLNGRSGADTTCGDIQLTVLETQGVLDNKRAFISFDNTIDEIQDMPANYSYPTDMPIFGPDGCTEIADNWADLMDGSIDRTLMSAGVLDDDEDIWWSGSNAYGAGSLSDDLCSGFFSSGTGELGRMGSSDKTNGLWLSNWQSYCDDYHFFLCIAEFTPAP